MQGWSHPAADGVGENRREGAASAPYLASTNGDLKRTLLRAFCLASFLEMMVGGNSSVCPALQLHVSTQWNTMRLRGGVARYPELLSEADLQERSVRTWIFIDILNSHGFVACLCLLTAGRRHPERECKKGERVKEREGGRQVQDEEYCEIDL